MSKRTGPPKHQNQFAWKPKAGVKINETEVGGRFRPLSEVTGVCLRCKEQIEWKRKYGKYKQLAEPAKCQRCSKRNVRQAYHNLCHGCAKEHKVCAKCSCHVERIIGRDITEVEAEQKKLEEAINNARERERRTLLRAMNKAKSQSSADDPSGNDDGSMGPVKATAHEESVDTGADEYDDVSVDPVKTTAHEEYVDMGADEEDYEPVDLVKAAAHEESDDMAEDGEDDVDNDDKAGLQGNVPAVDILNC